MDSALYEVWALEYHGINRRLWTGSDLQTASAEALAATQSTLPSWDCVRVERWSGSAQKWETVWEWNRPDD